MDPIMFTVADIDVMWYSFFILVAIATAIMLITREGKRFRYNSDFLFNLCFWVIIFSFLGARLYYVAFNFSLYENNLTSIFKVWEGGLAIHGGIIFGLLTIFIYTRKYNVKVIKILDMMAPALLLGQAIGRWGNFFNSEAYGSVTTIDTLEKFHIPEFIIEGMFINGNYHHPTFLYESLFCILGFLIIIILRRFKYIKLGTIVSFYLIWYGVGRFFIESLRTDSLMFSGFKVAQIVSVIMIIIGIIIIMSSSRKSKFEDLYNIEENSVRF